MSNSEFGNQENERAYAEQRKEKLKESFGIALSTKQKEGGTFSLESQAEMAEGMNLNSVQFDFRNRSIEEIRAASPDLIKYRETHPDVILSIHGETPRIDETSGDYANKDRIAEELKIADELGSESYTVHPPAIKQELYYKLPEQTRETLIRNYINIFIDQLRKQTVESKSFSLAIENMPNEGEVGAFGQTPEVILALIQKIEEELKLNGLDPEIAHNSVGATLDINHALHGINPSEYEATLESWFQKLGDYLKVVHIYTPSKMSNEFTQKYNAALELAARYNPNAKLFMESKQAPETTQVLYSNIKNI